jgi:hypothetical protein
MNRTIALSTLLALLLPFGVGTAQTEPTTIPGAIKLLPGYHYQKDVGVDSNAGKIWKQGGVKIEHDIGALAGNYADCKTCGWNDGELWRKKQTVNGQEAIVVLTKSKRLIVVFPESKANFYATIHTEEDLTDALLMLCTFQKMTVSY